MTTKAKHNKVEVLKFNIPANVDLKLLSHDVSNFPNVTMEHEFKGKVIPPDGGGMHFEFSVVPDSRELTLHVINRPEDVSLEFVHGHITSDLKNLYGGYLMSPGSIGGRSL